MHTADDDSPTAFDRGYEVWLMTEARKRNPVIHTSGLEWGVPGWVNEGGYFGDKNTQYLLAWIHGLKEKKNLTLDSISLGRNEAGYDVDWIKRTRQAMNAAGGFSPHSLCLSLSLSLSLSLWVCVCVRARDSWMAQVLHP